MRFYFLIAFLALFAGAFAESDVQMCRRVNSDIVQAINNFCGWTWDLTVPSPKALIGSFSRNNRVKVAVDGSTCRRTWIPRKYCLSQMFRTCAIGVKTGRGGGAIAGFGKNKCQKFIISFA